MAQIIEFAKYKMRNTPFLPILFPYDNDQFFVFQSYCHAPHVQTVKDAIDLLESRPDDEKAAKIAHALKTRECIDMRIDNPTEAIQWIQDNLTSHLPGGFISWLACGCVEIFFGAY